MCGYSFLLDAKVKIEKNKIFKAMWGSCYIQERSASHGNIKIIKNKIKRGD